MEKYIEIDGNGVVYCPYCRQGRISYFILKNEGLDTYICEECDSTWFSIDDIFDDEKGQLLIPYLRSLGYAERITPEAWSRIAEDKGLLLVKDVEDVAEKMGVKIAYI